MRSPVHAIRDRLAPAVLTAAGVTLLAVGLLDVVGPAQAGPGQPTPSATIGGGPVPTFAVPSLPQLDGSPAPSAQTSPPVARVATRVVVESLRIDLPVIAQPDPAYPSCNVAMYFEHPRLGQPGSGRSIYLYAHARRGMFLPLLTGSQRNNGKAMLGALVDVYTNDDQRFVYAITRVLRHVPADNRFLDRALAVTEETLWLQTSEGPGGQFPKLQVMARLVGAVPADHEEANPKARPVACG